MLPRLPCRFLASLGLAAMLTLCGTTGWSQEEKPRSEEQERVEAALQLTKAEAEKYEFFPTKDAPACQFVPRPILRWSNPERGQIYGNVFLWTHDGRPSVVGSLYKWYAPFTHMSHEFHSLSTGGLNGRFQAKDAWNTDEPGVVFADLPEAGEVATTPAARLTQMRQLARRFVARSTDPDGQTVDLRLLPQPVYRYELTPNAEKLGLRDGGLFAFVQGTDPEIWLLIEAHGAPVNQPAHWRYACVRMNSIALKVDYQGKELWSVPPISSRDVGSHQGPYTKFQFNQP